MRTAGIALASALLWSPLVAVSAAPPADGVAPVVDLIPAERAAWTPKNVLVGLSGVFGGWNYWYAERTMEIETVPPDAVLGLYYLRQNFQKRFERAEAPAKVLLPARADTTGKDAVRIHATANGYLAKDVSFSSRDVPERVTITLSALPNSLVFLGQTSFARPHDAHAAHDRAARDPHDQDHALERLHDRAHAHRVEARGAGLGQRHAA